MKQYRITSENLNMSSDDDCYLAPDDPAQEIKILQYLGGLNSEARLYEYRLQNQAADQGSNISITGNEKGELMKKHNIKPGTPEWFRLWFTLPYLTNTKPIGDISEGSKK
jgi:hypothetical protein